MNLKKAIIVHGWEGHPGEAWFPWLKKELEQLGVQVEVPQMPDTENPTLGKWLPYLEKVVGEPDENLVIIGHSLANITALRFLEGLPEGKRIGKLVMVGGYVDNLGFKELDSFFQKPIDWANIKKHCSSFVAINSDDDQYVPLENADIFKEKLGAKVIIEHNKRHMGHEDNMVELQSVLEAVKE